MKRILLLFTLLATFTAAMAQSKLKQIERMIPIEAPESYDLRTFNADFEPIDAGVKDMLQVSDLAVGYDKPLSTVNLKVEKGDRIGIIGGNPDEYTRQNAHNGVGRNGSNRCHKAVKPENKPGKRPDGRPF